MMKRRNPATFHFNTLKRVVLLCVLLAACAACAPSSKITPALEQLSVRQYPDFADDIQYDGLIPCLTRTLAYLEKLAPDRTFSFGEATFTAAHMRRTFEVFLNYVAAKQSKKALKQFLKEKFLVFRAAGGQESGKVLFTGYFEPEIRGSLQKSPQYPYPVYPRPYDVITIDLSRFSPEYEGKKLTGRLEGHSFLPYYDRKAIEEDRALSGKVRPLAWVEDRIDLFFLQIQGSGKIRLADGRIMNIRYGGQNGRPYRSIGKLLRERGEIPAEKMSMQAIKAWLRSHPGAAAEILNHNPSYVFFSVVEDGPFGALSVKLSPGRSIAVDRRVFPLPGLAYMETRKPLVDADMTIEKWTACNRFGVSQDTGGAIKGPGRADLFWGSGPYAEQAAGRMKHDGNLYFLVLKPAAD